MDILKQLQTEAEQVEVVHLRNESTTIEFEANRFKTSKVEETSGIAARVVRNGRLGFSASSDDKALDRLVTNVLESAAWGDKVPITFPTPQAASQVKTFDPAIPELPVARLVEIGQEIVDLILSVEPGAQVNVNLNRGVQQIKIQNQAGVEASFRRSPLSIGAEVDRIEGDDVLILYDMLGTTTWDEDYLAFAHRLVDKLKLACTLTTMRSGKMPVLFSPTGSLVLGLPLMEGLNGKNVFTGISPIRGKVGEKLFDDKITVVDDGALDGKYGSAPYDDEGVPHRRNVLVERGVLKGFLYDLKTAAQSGVESTGNGSRGLFNPPAPEPTNLILAGGSTPLSEMIAGIDEGLLVEDILGLGQGNIISGAFSNPLGLAFKIEKGEIVGRVKDVSIAGNVYDLLKEVAAVSQETLWVYGRLCMPYVLLPEMNVVAKE
ncbi:MAG: TldD/PmbA family protein [Anaerolineae bacterium]|nr:TldD/PmbA family protein [Anaerolineae bacterium]